MKTRSNNKMNSTDQDDTHKKNKDTKDTKNKQKDNKLIVLDEDVGEDELDERGNIKGLIDYSDEEDYQVYDKEMKRRDKIIADNKKKSEKSEIEDIGEDLPGNIPGGNIIIFALSPVDDDGSSEDTTEEIDDDGSSDLDELDTDDILTDDDVSSKKEDKPNKIYNTRSGDKNNNKRVREEDDDRPINKRQRTEPPELKGPGDFLNMLLGGGSKKEQLKQKVIKSKIPEQYKPTILNRIEHMDSDKAKEAQWVDNILKIPFGKYAKVPVTFNSKKENIEKFFNTATETLDKAVYGLDTVKEEIMNYLAQFISTNNESMPRILALQGHPGVGKTAIVRNGISKVLDRPMKTINIGGLRDSSHFLGFDYTYSGSRYGIIASSIIEAGIMNPIIFMDELDKISLSNDGIEIQNLLIHLTDPVQNHAFHDKYFAGIDLDMSKAIFIFSFNDMNLVHPVLKDRLHIIRVPDPSVDDKIVIGKRYLLPEMCKNVGIKLEDVTISDDILRSVINSYCKEEKGVRDLKRSIETLLLRINLARYIGKCKYSKIDKIQFPFIITKEVVEILLKKRNSQEDWPEHVKNMYM